MNSKMIAIIAVVAMCGAALVGVGYAYNATYTTGDDGITVNTQYVTIGPNGSTTADWVITDTLKYTSTNTNGTIVYEPAGTATISKTYTVVVDFTNYSGGSSPINLTVSPSITRGASVSDKITFSDPTVSYKVIGAEGDSVGSTIAVTPSAKGNVSYDVTITYTVTDTTESYPSASMISSVSAKCNVTFTMQDLVVS